MEDEKNIDLDSMDLDELYRLEDSLLSEEEQENKGSEESSEQSEPGSDTKPDERVDEKPEGSGQEELGKESISETGDNGEQDKADNSQKPEKGGDKETASEGESVDEPERHVSPPRKWIERRYAERAKAAESDYARRLEELEAENKALRERSEALKAIGVDPGEDIVKLDPETLKNIESDYGRDVANLLVLAKSKLIDGTKSISASEEGETKPKRKEQHETLADVEFDKYRRALEENEHIAYWADKREDLYNLAVSVEQEMLGSRFYLNKTYPDRAVLIVEEVLKRHAVRQREPEKDDGEQEKPPVRMPGNAGASPTSKPTNEPENVLSIASADVEAAHQKWLKMQDGEVKSKLESMIFDED